MKYLINLFAIGSLLLTSACSQENIPNEPTEGVSSKTSMRVTLDEALKRADRVFRGIERSATRRAPRKVKSIEYLGASRTRSDTNDPLYYVVNYDNDEGFAVLGADKRLDGVYAFSEEGTLDMNDTTFNVGLNIFFRSLPKDPGQAKDTIIQIPQPDPGIIEQHFNISYGNGPLLTPAVRKWGQRNPYNFFCPLIKKFRLNPSTGAVEWYEERSIAGCAPVAIAQLMTFYECPKQYGNYTLNWDEMKTWMPGQYSIYGVSENGAARLIREIGKEGNMNTNYGTTGSSSPLKNYKRTFKTFEYNEPEDFKTFSTDNLFDYVYFKSKPVLAYGENDNGGSHLWVIDGMWCDKWKYVGSIGTTYYGEGYFFHVVWGWDGECNGYFKHGSAFIHSDIKYDPSDPNKYEWEYYSGTDYDWEERVKLYRMKFCGNITPR